MFMQVSGLKIALPATPADAKGLLKTAVRCGDPVICFEDGKLWSHRGPVAEDPERSVPLGVAEVRRSGTDATVVAFGGAVPEALAAASALAGERRRRADRPGRALTGVRRARRFRFL
jgi:pyruvate/2-oxoglutarate/acetoin dehydrogenase E1 component